MESTQQAESKLERVIRKIKRCLALSQSANEHEAATAMRQAQALMREHQLTETDVHLSDVGESESSHSRATRRPQWDRGLSSTVADVFGCESLQRTHWCPIKERRVERAVFVGVAPANEIALYAYESLLAKVTQGRKDYIAAVRAGIHRSDYTPETAGDHFAMGWVGQVYRKMLQLVPKGETDEQLPQHSSGTELMAVQARSSTLIAEYLESKKVGKARKTPKMELDLTAQIAGMLAGQKVELHAGLASGGEGQPLLSGGRP